MSRLAARAAVIAVLVFFSPLVAFGGLAAFAIFALSFGYLQASRLIGAIVEAVR